MVSQNAEKSGNGLKIIIMKKLFILLLCVACAARSYTQQTGTLTDSRDGKSYKTIQIGTQVWMAENLAFHIAEKCWVYENNPDNLAANGNLYTWESAQDACPTGWRLPSEGDYKLLLDQVGGAGKQAFQNLIPAGTSGFAATLGGWRRDDGVYRNIDEYGLFWTSSKSVTGGGFLSVDSRYKIARVFYGKKYYGYSVRCIKTN
jgi:uncharacterized protein (TIGR02145 family)